MVESKESENELVEDIYQPSQNEDWQHELLQLSVSYIELLREYRGLLTIMLSMKLKELLYV